MVGISKVLDVVGPIFAISDVWGLGWVEFRTCGVWVDGIFVISKVWGLG